MCVRVASEEEKRLQFLYSEGDTEGMTMVIREDEEK